MKLKSWLLTAEMAAFIAIFSQFIIPLGTIPLTGQTLSIGLMSSIFKRKIATSTILLYFFMGLIGLPVFAGGHSGFVTFLGPTGGFLLGFLGQAFFTSWFLEKRDSCYLHFLFANLFGSFFTLFCGSLWLTFFLDYPLAKAFQFGFIAFLLPTLLNASLAARLGQLLKKRLKNFL